MLKESKDRIRFNMALMLTEDSEGTDREKNQCSSVQPSCAEAKIAPSHPDNAIEVLIQEEVPRSEPE